MEAPPKSSAKESIDSSPPAPAPPKSEQSKPPAVPSIGKKFQLRSEIPTVPVVLEPAFGVSSEALQAAGNQALTVELKERGHLGYYLKRANSLIEPTLVELKPTNFYDGIRHTLRAVLLRLHRMKKELGDLDFVERCEQAGDVLATGCCIQMHAKIRAIMCTESLSQYVAQSLRRPRAASDLVIPAPYAFAIQQLGAVNVIDLPTEVRIIPSLPSTGCTFGLPEGITWNSNAYAQAVDYARNIGMQFAIVDVKVKNGTAWWLMRQSFSEDVFELNCILPEVNYTDAMALTQTLFLYDRAPDPSNTFVNLDLFTANFGSMLRNPHQGINVSSYEALENSSSAVWANV